MSFSPEGRLANADASTLFSRSIWENADTLAALLDPHGRILDLNPSMAASLGRPVMDLKGSPISGHLPLPHRAPFAEVLRQVRELGVSRRWCGWGDSASRELMVYPCFSETHEVIGVSLLSSGVVIDLSERKREEDALRESHRDLLEAQRIARLGNWDWDLHTGKVRWSAEIYKMHGMDPGSEALTPETLLGFVHPDDLEKVRTAISQAVTNGTPANLDYRLFRRDGSIRVIHAVGAVTEHDTEGRPARMVGTNQDITERSEAERLLIADLDAMKRLQQLGAIYMGQANLESILGEAVATAIAIASADFGNIQLLDPVSGELRIAAQRGFPQWWVEFWNKVAPGKGCCGTALERGERIIVEDVELSPIFAGSPALDVQLRAGVRAVQSTPLLSRSGKPLGMFSTHYRTAHRPDERALVPLDLLARQVAEIIEHARNDATLRELNVDLERQVHARTADLAGEREQLRKVLQMLETASSAGKVVLGEVAVADGSFVCTANLDTMLGFPAGGFGRSLADWERIIHPDDISRVRDELKRLLEGGSQFDTEYRVRRMDGTTIWWKGVASGERDEDGKVIKVTGTVVDITERKQLEERLRQSQKMEAVGHLAGGMAHEFNNILAGMMMSLGLARMGSKVVDQDQVLSDLEESCNRSADLIKKLLAFSRQSVMHRQSLNLAEVVAGHARTLKPLLGERIELVVFAPQHLPQVKGDKVLIEQVVLNLCLNARDAMREGGQLRLEVSLAQVGEDRPQTCADARPGRFVCLSVSDTGCGMDATVKERLFEPFFTTKEIGQGTGLGLATVRGIVQQHQGWVEVDSEPGQGSRFRVYFPAEQPTTPKAHASSTPETMPSSGCGTILIAEDDDKLRTLSATLLSRQGYRVLEAANGGVALALWAAHRHDIVLLYSDMVMPGELSGLQLAERCLAEKPNLKVIITSGYNSEHTAIEKAASASIDYLPKPCQPDRLLAVIHRALSAKEPAP